MSGNFDNLSDFNITVVGLGLIGGSIAKSIRKNLKIQNLWAIDIDEAILSRAGEEGIIDEGFTQSEFPLANSDMVILCTYPEAAVSFIEKNMDLFKPGAIITDTAGIKSSLVSKISSILRNDLEFIGGHPMCGRESIGYSFSSEKLFEGGQYILTPTEHSSETALAFMTKIIEAMGFKSVVLMSPQEHDKRIAFTSQLPHIIACALMNNNYLSTGFDGIGGSFRDATRVADINSSLWCELIIENKSNIMSEITSFIADLSNIYNIIENDDMDGLNAAFARSSLLRREMNK